MGSSTSKAAQTASKLSASNTVRKYPTRSPPPSSNKTNVQPPRPSPEVKLGPTVHPEVQTAETRNPSIDFDSADPDLSLQARLRSIGPVQPNPTLSNSSIYNFARSPTLSHSDVLSRSSTSPSTTQPSPTTTTTTSSHDPNLTHSQFQPSASSPSQSIFPTQNQAFQRENPAVSLLTARYRIAEEADAEFASLGKKGGKGRGFIDVQTLRQVVVLREQGVRARDIEERFGLRSGVVGKLGREGVVGIGS